ncbi:hypothetical protein UlMin_040330 [Ulmus minor]
MASKFSFLLLFFFVFPLVSSKGTPNVVIEEGYTVTTVIDGHKLGINPHSVLLRPGSSDLIVLDHSGSAFYRVTFPLSKDSVVNRFSGTGDVGYLDGEPGLALFNKPQSFAIDQRGNIYVADRNNNVIRKITSSGVTTIAGVNKKIGREDGPVQNATFSNNFEVVFVAEKCVLLVFDRGNQLVRQINLKAEDCVRGSQKGMSSVSIWAVTMGLACIMCFAVGLAVRPYLLPYTGRHRAAPFQPDMEALPNPSGETSSDTLLRHQKRNC